MPDERGTPLVELRDMSKAFGGIRAVDHVSFDLYPGEVMGVLGHNGAGKSVLMKMLSGALPRDSGQILINGEEAIINNPATPGNTISRRSTRRSRSPTISTRPRTCFWAGNS
jgi:D-xylose transport system ATP-binding protein